MNPENRLVETVFVCGLGYCDSPTSSIFVDNLQANLKKVGSETRVMRSYWCLGGCIGTNLILWPNGPICYRADLYPLEDIVSMVMEGKPIEGMRTNSGAGWSYIRKMLSGK